MRLVDGERRSSGLRYRVGIDIGGTFTDATLLDDRTGDMRIAKVLTTPADPSVGFMNAAARILGEGVVPRAEVAYVVHATTVATNAIIEGKVARTAFVTTQGFRDMLEIARQMRPSLYDLHFEKPRPLVPRHLCFELRERLDARGRVLVPLDEDEVRELAKTLATERVEAVAVCLLHSYVDPRHERRVGEILREALPDALVSLSSEVAPEFREYFRASTTVINASIRPIVSRYVHNIESRLLESEISSELLVMQSSGGVYSSRAARVTPVFMVESGPAAGVIAASYLGGAVGYHNLISFDMGGTTAKVGLIRDGNPHVTKDYEVGATATPGTGERRGSGYPIRTPVIDLVEIGAGGGSIAWVDSGGVLRVGPQSAGADPGPSCYGLGGVEPTVTDANLVLGRLSAGYFLGGEIALDVERARRAIDERCATPLGLGVVEAANAIVEIANAAMVNALRLVSVQRGFDPREFVLVAFGGAGPAHANRLAAENDIAITLVPTSPGITSSLGLLATDLKHDYATTLIVPADAAPPESLELVYRELEEKGRADLAREGVAPSEMTFVRQIDMRYVGQSHELPMGVGDAPLDAARIASLVSAFHEEHRRAYGFSAPHEPAELVNLRVTAVGAIAKPQLTRISSDGAGRDAVKATRRVYFAETGGFIDCAVYDRYALGAGSTVHGPAIVEESDSTTVVHPGYDAVVNDFGHLLITKATVE